MTEAFELKLICLQEERICFGGLDVKLRSKHNLCCNCKPSTSKTSMINLSTTSTTFISLWYLFHHCYQTTFLPFQLEHNIWCHHWEFNHDGNTFTTSCIAYHIFTCFFPIMNSYKGQLLPKKRVETIPSNWGIEAKANWLSRFIHILFVLFHITIQGRNISHIIHSCM